MDVRYSLRRTFPMTYEWLRGFKHPNQRRIERDFRRRHGQALYEATRRVHARVESAHAQEELLQVLDAVLTGPDGLVVEAGCWKGASTAKISLACAKAGKRLAVYDSFEGLPENDEPHEVNTDGHSIHFNGGEYAGPLELVKTHVAQYGDLGVCTFHKGWFSDTMPHLTEPVSVAYIDVDLVLSTADCLKALYPRLVPGGVIFSQDGHVPLVVDLLADDAFWENEIGVAKPPMDGLGTEKLVRIHR